MNIPIEFNFDKESLETFNKLFDIKTNNNDYATKEQFEEIFEELTLRQWDMISDIVWEATCNYYPPLQQSIITRRNTQIVMFIFYPGTSIRVRSEFNFKAAIHYYLTKFTEDDLTPGIEYVADEDDNINYECMTKYVFNKYMQDLIKCAQSLYNLRLKTKISNQTIDYLFNEVDKEMKGYISLQEYIKEFCMKNETLLDRFSSIYSLVNDKKVKNNQDVLYKFNKIMNQLIDLESYVNQVSNHLQNNLEEAISPFEDFIISVQHTNDSINSNNSLKRNMANESVIENKSEIADIYSEIDKSYIRNIEYKIENINENAISNETSYNNSPVSRKSNKSKSDFKRLSNLLNISELEESSQEEINESHLCNDYNNINILDKYKSFIKNTILQILTQVCSIKSLVQHYVKEIYKSYSAGIPTSEKTYDIKKQIRYSSNEILKDFLKDKINNTLIKSTVPHHNQSYLIQNKLSINDSRQDKKDFELIQAIVEGLRQNLVSSEIKRKNFVPNDFNMQFTFKPMIQRSEKSSKTYKFCSFAYQAFEILRKKMNLSNKRYMERLGILDLLNALHMKNFSTLKSIIGQGKSGAFFMMSPDKSLILKSITSSEFRFMMQICESYCNYMCNHPQTLVQKILGVYQIDKSALTMHFIIMENVMHGFDRHLTLRYDLKGSHHGRTTAPAERQDRTICRKDVDFEQDIADGTLPIRLPVTFKREFEVQLERDVAFLRHLRIIDYSLLFGIIDVKAERVTKEQLLHEKTSLKSTKATLYNEHSESEDEEEEAVHPRRARPLARDLGWVESGDKKYFYTFGIIDILTEYTLTKQLETKLKTLFYEDISCVPPEQYSERFYSFFKNNLLRNY